MGVAVVVVPRVLMVLELPAVPLIHLPVESAVVVAAEEMAEALREPPAVHLEEAPTTVVPEETII
jgi:hypothetical protein